MASVYKTMGIQLSDDMDDRFLTTVGAVGSIFNGGSRILAGQLMDKYSFKNIFYCILITQLLVCSTLTIVCSYNKYLYLLWIVLAYNCLGSHFVVFPAEMVKTFGVKSGSKLYSLLYIGIGVGQVSTLFASQYLTSLY